MDVCFFYSGIFVIDMSSYAIVDEACRATNTLFSDFTCYMHVNWYTSFLRRHNSVLEMGHLSLVHLRSVEVWDRAFLSASV